MKLEEDEIKKTIDYTVSRYTGENEILGDEEERIYKIYSEKEILESIDDCVIFLLKMIRKHAKYLLKE